MIEPETSPRMDWLLERLAGFGEREAVIGPGVSADYADLVARVEEWPRAWRGTGVRPGSVVAVIGDALPATVALVLALARAGCTVVPMSPRDPAPEARAPRFATAEVETVFEFTDPERWTATELTRPEGPGHPLLSGLRSDREPGLVLFSSGSTGETKAAVLSLPRLLDRFRAETSRPWRTLQFLGFDHIGGVNTLFHTLCNGGAAIVEPRRTAERVCRAVEEHRVELLPTTPTFLNMLLISGAHRDHDLSSLRLITYGTEPMREVTLQHLARTFPEVRLKQTYGLTETGILPTRSDSSTSLGMRIGGDGFETKIVDGVLWVRSPGSMLGYLNSVDPFEADGWLNTGDVVEEGVDGSLRVIGRRSKIINIGGEKVFPARVENVLLQAPNVRDVVVHGRSNAVTGQVVAARVDLLEDEEPRVLAKRLRLFCAGRLAPHEIPAVFVRAEEPLHGSRFKRQGWNT
ncbi:class I adenylate-forming enzyme family protein [Streptomyces virginiae]|uniref:class I adenylate-forming enzyme family protein n=1 Tax=Streptomyces virginiae TaxID=1961 RepID=UPI0035D6164B